MEMRPVRLEEAGDVHQLTRRWESFWNAPLVTPLHEVEEELTEPHMDLAEHTRGVWDGDRMVAYGRIWHRPSGEILERAYLQGRVDPEHRGRGIGRQLFGWQVETATRILGEIEAPIPRFMRADEWDWIEEAHRMYRRFGMEPVRYFTEMVKPLDVREEVEPIDGVEIISYDRSWDVPALEALNRSFADHWGSSPTDMASYQHRLEGKGVALDLSFLAIFEGKVVGLSLNAHYPEDEELLGRRDGWIESLGVVKNWRRKGVATALLKASFNVFAEAGFTHAALGVDTANPNDALKLYTGLGFETTHRSITSELEVKPLAPVS
ncbi:MAG: GNAT family N-acetyltransferase [Acidimicrobiia bacterium]